MRRWFACALVAAFVVAMAAGSWLAVADGSAWPARAASPNSEARAAATPSASPVPAPHIVRALIPYGATRRRQMAAYCRRHYGVAKWRLHPRAIVLHFTAGPTYASARATFVSNAPNRGELPGVAAHFIIAQTGRIYQLLPTTVRCRHTIGLNYCAIGIEMVQVAGSGSHWADQQILHRRRQIGAALRLVRYLRAKYSIKMRNVIGHATANRSLLFKDLEGWHNDHTDWLAVDVRAFRARLAALR
jgi:N-acetylmuramoyl-L-alanine amidase